MMRRSFACQAAVLVVLSGALAPVASQETAALSTWVERQFASGDNPLHTEFVVNGATVDIFTSDALQPIAAQIKDGWNTIVLKTTPQVPATKRNGLIFRVGPARQQGTKVAMSPVLWRFDNETD
jgi:hypothetical protein